jgi:hypothetical protein
MTFVSRSVFFSMLCLSLMSFSCASGLKQESRQDELKKECLEQFIRAGVGYGVQQCSVQRLSPSECEKLKDEFVEKARPASEEYFLKLEKDCKDYRLSEADCNMRKETQIRKIFEWVQ